MLEYIIKRLLQAVFVVFAAYTFAFFLLYALPSDPISLFLGPDSTDIDPAQRAALAAKYGFDQPVIVQYFNHLLALLHGDLGFSLQQSRSVGGLITEALRYTLPLAGLGFLVAAVFATVVCELALVFSNSWLRHVLDSLPALGNSIPGFWFGMLLIQFFSFKLRLLPAFGDNGPLGLILPALTIALPSSALMAQVFLKSMRENDEKPFVSQLRAEGIGRLGILFRHITPNSLLAVLTVAGMTVGHLLGGTAVVETVFSRPGLGRVVVTAVSSQDIPTVLGVVLVVAIIYSAANLLVDLAYGWIDPRIRLAGGRFSRLNAA